MAWDSPPADLERPVAEFSGGWRVRLAMASALAARADLLLLDEPTNHLDLDAIVWLEEWLTGFPGTLLMISHDREFLDAIIDRVLHIENRIVRAYAGNYSAVRAKARGGTRAATDACKPAKLRRIAEITDFVTRFRAKRHQVAPGAEPAEDAATHGEHRPGARGQSIRVRVRRLR